MSAPANLRCLENTRLRGFSLSEIYVLEQNFSTSFSAFTNRGKLACKFSSMGAIDQRCSSLARFLFDSAHISDSFKIVFRTATEAPSWGARRIRPRAPGARGRRADPRHGPRADAAAGAPEGRQRGRARP